MTMRFEKKYRIGQRGAVYEFEVKLSMKVRGVAISDEDMAADTRMALEEFEDTLRQKFRWIGRVYLTGRSGGWLAIEDKTGGASEGALEVIGEMVDAARERFEADLVQSYGYEAGLEPNASISPKLRKAYDFFKEHAPGVVGETGKGALDLARAEQYADDHGWEAVWEEDPEEWDADVERPFEVLNCVLRDDNGVVLASVGGVGFTGNTRSDKEIGRVIEAELALEAMPDRLTPNRAPRLAYVDELRQKSLSRLRHMQDIVQQQITKASRQGNTRALEELQRRDRELQAAVMEKEFGGDADLQRNARARAFHYTARIKGTTPTRFYVRDEPVADAAAHAFSGWAEADVTLWPTANTGEYVAKWYDKYSETFRESPLTIIEEMDAAGSGGDADLQRNARPAPVGSSMQVGNLTATLVTTGVQPSTRAPTETWVVRAAGSATTDPVDIYRQRGTWRAATGGVVRAHERELGQRVADARNRELQRNGAAPEPRRFVTGSGPWWTYYETGSFQAGDKAIHIHRTASQKLARINALNLQRQHGGFVTVIHRGREAGTVGPERASWIPERAP